MTKAKESAYDEHISPLMGQVIKLCKEHKINMAAQFALDVGDDGDDHDGHVLYCTTVLHNIDPGCAESVERMNKLRKVMHPPHPDFFALTIIQGAAK